MLFNSVIILSTFFKIVVESYEGLGLIYNFSSLIPIYTVILSYWFYWRKMTSQLIPDPQTVLEQVLKDGNTLVKLLITLMVDYLKKI